jgi:hypothetical protein
MSVKDSGLPGPRGSTCFSSREIEHPPHERVFSSELGRESIQNRMLPEPLRRRSASPVGIAPASPSAAPQKGTEGRGISCASPLWNQNSIGTSTYRQNGRPKDAAVDNLPRARVGCRALLGGARIGARPNWQDQRSPIQARGDLVRDCRQL